MCSGIAAPELAMPKVEWRWCAEIDPFCCAVLAERHPGVPNLGSVTDGTFLSRAKAYGNLDLLVAGTPCQSFSVAGLRKSLKDERGNITLQYVKTIHALKPTTTLWENVPGVLSTHDNAFGGFLAGLVGADEAITPTAKWNSAGVASGPLGTAAWRVLDAQYFGLAQRRARLFLVFCFGDSARPGEILFEFEGMRRDFAPSRSAGQGSTGTLSARTNGGGGLGTDFEIGGGIQPVPLSRIADGESADRETAEDKILSSQSSNRIHDTAACLDASYGRLQGASGQDAKHGHSHLIPEISMCLNGKGGSGRIDGESETFVTCPLTSNPYGDHESRETMLVTHALRADGFDASEDGTGRGTPIIVDTLRSHPRPGSNTTGAVIPILEAGARCGHGNEAEGLGIGQDGDPMFTLQSGKQHAIAFSSKDHGADAGDVAPTLRAMECDQSHANGGGQLAVAFDATQITSKANYSEPKDGEPCHPLAAGAHAPAIAFQSSQSGMREVDVHATLDANNGSRRHNGVSSGMAVRRLTPRECCRLQGFPDDYLDIIFRGKPAADGNKYRSLGNSMAVPVLAWLGERIRAVDGISRSK